MTWLKIILTVSLLVNKFKWGIFGIFQNIVNGRDDEGKQRHRGLEFRTKEPVAEYH